MQTIKLSLVFVLGIVLVSGCAINPERPYRVLITREGPVALTNNEAISNSSPVPLMANQLVRSELDLDDPMIQFGRARSNYKVFAIDGQQGQAYRIELRTLCDCLGFDRKARNIIYPITYIVDSQGSIVRRPVEVDEGDEPQGVPKNVKAVIEGTFDASNTYYLIVAADTRRLGLTVPSDNEALKDVPFPYVSLPIASYPVGDFTVRLTTTE